MTYEYVVVVKRTEALLVRAANAEEAKRRAEAVARYGRPDADVAALEAVRSPRLAGN